MSEMYCSKTTPHCVWSYLTLVVVETALLFLCHKCVRGKESVVRKPCLQHTFKKWTW